MFDAGVMSDRWCRDDFSMSEMERCDAYLLIYTCDLLQDQEIVILIESEMK